jgi:hypothetical protein
MNECAVDLLGPAVLAHRPGRLRVSGNLEANGGERAALSRVHDRVPEVFPSGFYDVRCFRADDRSKLVEITRERFQLRNHSVGLRRGSVPRRNPRLAPKALPISEDDVKPRRLAAKAVPSEDKIKPRRAVEAR